LCDRQRYPKSLPNVKMSGTDKLPAMRVAVIGAGYARHSDPEYHMLTKPKSRWIDNPKDVARGIDT
jgi:hypothetical protein